MPAMQLDVLRRELSYDPIAGIVSRTREGKLKGRPAGRAHDERGYLRFRLFGRYLYVHRVAWALATGTQPGEIDHINGDPSDNRLCNLRPATRTENTCNRSSQRLKGVHPLPSGRFRAAIHLDGRRIYHPGTFATRAQAAAAYDALAVLHHGEFARLNFPAPSASYAEVW